MSAIISMKKTLVLISLTGAVLILYFVLSRHFNRITVYTYSDEIKELIPECKYYSDFSELISSSDSTIYYEKYSDGTTRPNENTIQQLLNAAGNCSNAIDRYIEEKGADVDGISISYKYD